MHQPAPTCLPHHDFPSFIVGITGHMKLEAGSDTDLKKKVGEILSWLRRAESTDPLLDKPLGLCSTPITLLSSLAPGADQLAVEAALEKGVDVRCPLPFPAGLYEQATTFQGSKELKDGYCAIVRKIIAAKLRAGMFPQVVDAASAGEPATKEEERESFAQKLQELLFSSGLAQPALGGELLGPVVEELRTRHFFLVMRHEDLPLPEEEKLKSDLQDEKDNGVRRNLRYRSAGEYVSAYSDLLIALTDQKTADAPDPYSSSQSKNPFRKLPGVDPTMWCSRACTA